MRSLMDVLVLGPVRSASARRLAWVGFLVAAAVVLAPSAAFAAATFSDF